MANGVELVWEGKKKEVERIALPFQRVEIINESRGTRREMPLFAHGAGPRLPADPLFAADQPSVGAHSNAPLHSPDQQDGWRNKLIWGDNKYVLASLLAGDPSIGLEPLAGKVDLIYIDPPFATGADFVVSTVIGDDEVDVTKEHSAIEETAYRDTWGAGLSSYAQMMYERLTLM